MPWRNLLWFLFIWVFSLPSQAADLALRIHGSNTVGATLAPALAEAWLESRGFELVEADRNPEHSRLRAKNDGGDTMTVEILARGSSTGFRGLESGAADLAMSSRPIRQKEIASLAALGEMTALDNEFVIALDGIAVVVHPDNPIGTLTKSQVRDIFSGKIADWKELGRAPGAIDLYARDDASGTFDVFKTLVLGKTHPLSAKATRHDSNAALVDEVAGNTNGIGFSGLAYASMAKPVAIADGEAPAIAPTTFSVATEDYALARRLFFYLPGESSSPAARELADFAISDAAQPVIERNGFVSQRVFPGTDALGQDYPESMLKLAQGAQRLSVNMRFEKTSIELDNKAKRDADRVRSFLSEAGMLDNEVLLFGFAEKDEALPMISLERSSRRAQQVGKYLRSNGIKVLKTRGYGGAAPVASNETDLGKQKNRRVEIWVKTR